MLEGFEKKVQDHPPSGLENQRSNPRYPLSSTVEVIDIQGNTRIMGRIADIAKTGCYVDTINPFPPKAAVFLRITKDQQTFETKAMVVYSQTGMGMGLSFTTTEPEQLRTLEGWLAELSGEKAPDANQAGSVPLDAAKSVDEESRSGLSELVRLLNRKGVLTGPEGNAILRRFLK
jgi:PilZ domain